MDTCIINSYIRDLWIIISSIIGVEVEKEVLVNFAWVTRPERPKDDGLHLEVGARRAPRLLIVYISQNYMQN